MERHPPDKLWTYDDLLALPASTDGRRYEILDGILVVSPAPGTKHQRVLGNLYTMFRRTLHDTRIAEVFVAPFDVVLSTTRVAEPDLVIIAAHRRGILERRGVAGAPDLVIEILSPSNTKHDLVTKRRMYARSGIREYWIVDPQAEAVEVLALIDDGLSYRQVGYHANGETLASTVFELALSVDEIFADPFAEPG